MRRLFLQFLIPIIMIIAGSFIIFLMINNISDDEEEIRRLNLENTHNITIKQFSGAIDRFAGLVSGMHTYMDFSEQLPTAEEFQKFVKYQFKNINLNDSIVVSFIDTSHTFIYSFTLNEMDPYNLANTSVKSMRDKEDIDFLNDLMMNDDLKLDKPLNLVEGWVGIPLDFRIYRENEVKGYIAPIINFETIIQSIYEYESINKEYVFHFMNSEGSDFDREKVYDGSQIYNQESDPQYYKNFNVDTANFIYSTVNKYGMNFTIGTGFKHEKKNDIRFVLIIIIWFVSIIIFISFITIQIERYKKLNSDIINKNQILGYKQLEIEENNKQLNKLNNTKNKLFSIIGHDLRGPIGSVISIMKLLQNQKIEDPKTYKIVKRLNVTAKNTLSLIDNLLQWSRSQFDGFEYNPKNFNLEDLISDVCYVLHEQANEKLIKFQCDLEKNLSYYGDYEMISTAVRNLLSNAIKFSFEGSEVMIKSFLQDHKLFIKIVDKGIGISEKDINRLFDTDHHITTRGTSGEKGTGLGLLLCNEFIEMHNGVIHIISKINVGSEFTIELPIEKEA